MGKAIADILPFTAGMIMTPFAVIAVAVLLVSKGGLGKALAFVAGFVIVSFLLCFVLAQLIGGESAQPGTQPEWVHVLLAIIGVLLLVVALDQLPGVLRHHRDPARTKPPGWLAVADRISAPKAGWLGGVLDLNPVNLSMTLAAGAALGSYNLAGGEDAIVAAVFAVIGSLGVLAPILIAVLPGLRDRVSLHDLRHWLVDHSVTISFVTTLIFALLFLGKGLRGP
ncbi:MAG: GAP family protein [Sporichthyaceae bacterium]|nr:GAP family protein [Sporichthyaceae bacterium]